MVEFEALACARLRTLTGGVPRPQGRRLLRVALSGIMLGGLLLGVGAAAAAWMFRAPLAGVVLRWEAVPATPQTPGRPFPAPPVPSPAASPPRAPSDPPGI